MGMNFELEERFLEATAPADAGTERFAVTDAGKASWAIGKIKLYRQRIKTIEEVAEVKRHQLDAWVASETQRLEGEIAYFTELLRPYAMQELEGKKTRTVKLDTGSLSFRKGSVSYDKDDETLLAFVQENAPEYIKVTPKVDWAEYKKTLTQAENGRLVTADGELVPGVIYAIGDDVFTVKTEG